MERSNLQRTEDSDFLIEGNSFRLFVEVNSLIAAMVSDIRKAQNRVWVESYTIANDHAGQAIVAALTERANAGVKVRLMYDAIGSFGISKSFFDPLVRAGGQVHAFHSLTELLGRFSFLRLFNRRNHRKLMIVDEQISFFGGMNLVSQEGLEITNRRRRGRLTHPVGWRDVHVRMCAPQQAEIAASMDWLWKRVHHQRPPARPAWQVSAALQSPDDAIHFFDSLPVAT